MAQDSSNADPCLGVTQSTKLLGDGHLVGPGNRQVKVLQDVLSGTASKVLSSASDCLLVKRRGGNSSRVPKRREFVVRDESALPHNRSVQVG